MNPCPHDWNQLIEILVPIVDTWKENSTFELEARIGKINSQNHFEPGVSLYLFDLLKDVFLIHRVPL